MMAQRTVKKTPRIPVSDWRNLPTDKWTPRTFNVYFTDMNREFYGVETYLPFRNWATEQSILKRAIATHGNELLRKAFDIAFREYRPTREYPLLTAGFAVNYRINTIIPRIKAEEAARERIDRVISEGERIASDDELAAWL